MVDLHRSFKNLLREYGFDVLLQRRKDDVPSGPHPLPVFENTLERHTVRSTYARSANLAKTATEEEEGLIGGVDIVFYFRAEVKPREDDLIVELGNAVQGVFDRVEFHQCHALVIVLLVEEPEVS